MVLRSERKQEQLSGFLSLWFLARIGILWEAGSGWPEKAGIEECVNDWLDCGRERTCWERMLDLWG